MKDRLVWTVTMVIRGFVKAMTGIVDRPWAYRLFMAAMIGTMLYTVITGNPR